MDAIGKVKQRMGHIFPEGAQRIKCKAVFSGGLDIFWGRASVSDGIDGAVYSAESGRREEGSEDGMRCVRGEFG